MRGNTTDQDLVRRLRAGDDRAAADLDREYGPRIEQVALRVLRNPEDAEEVRQDVLLQVTRKIDGFRGDAALTSWLHRIAFNKSVSMLRRSTADRRIEVSLDGPRSRSPQGQGHSRVDIADWSTLADDALYRSEMRIGLARALARLPRIYRVPVLLRDVMGLSTNEASAALQVRPQTLKSRLRRGRLRLRGHLADFAGDIDQRRAA